MVQESTNPDSCVSSNNTPTLCTTKSCLLPSLLDQEGYNFPKFSLPILLNIGIFNASGRSFQFCEYMDLYILIKKHDYAWLRFYTFLIGWWPFLCKSLKTITKSNKQPIRQIKHSGVAVVEPISKWLFGDGVVKVTFSSLL